MSTDDPQMDETDDSTVGTTAMAAAQVFLGAIEALEELIAQASPHVAQLDKPEQAFRDIKGVIEQIPADCRERVRDLFDSARLEADNAGRWVREVIDGLLTEFGPNEWVFGILQTLEHAASFRPRLPLLYEAILISLVSEFEALLGRLLTLFYREHPNALDGSQFSLADLRLFNSIDEAAAIAIERQVDTFLRANLDEWADWFQKKLKCDLRAVAGNWSIVHEAYHRRHVVVHAAGVASPQYIASTRDDSVDIVKGDQLTVDREYLECALDEYTALGVLVAALAASHLKESDRPLILSRLHRLDYSLMLRGRWRAVQAISAAGERWDEGRGKLVFQCNRWLAAKRQQGTDAIRDEVARWDASVLSSEFRLVQAVLLDEVARGLDLLPLALAGGDITREDVYEWPVLEELRAEPRFLDVMSATQDASIANASTGDGPPPMPGATKASP